MRPAPSLVLVLALASQPGDLPAQDRAGVIVVRVASDGTCEAAGLRGPCGEVGSKLRAAGIPPDMWFTFDSADPLNYAALRTAGDSLARAGYNNMKIGFIAAPTH
jgi:hypothetical protein